MHALGVRDEPVDWFHLLHQFRRFHQSKSNAAKKWVSLLHSVLFIKIYPTYDRQEEFHLTVYVQVAACHQTVQSVEWQIYKMRSLCYFWEVFAYELACSILQLDQVIVFGYRIMKYRIVFIETFQIVLTHLHDGFDTQLIGTCQYLQTSIIRDANI